LGVFSKEESCHAGLFLHLILTGIEVLLTRFNWFSYGSA